MGLPGCSTCQAVAHGVPLPAFDAAFRHNGTLSDPCRRPEQVEGQLAVCQLLQLQLLQMVMRVVLCLHSPQ